MIKNGGNTPELPDGYELPDYEQRVAEIEANGGVFNNLQMGKWLAGGRGIQATAGMSPATYYDVYGPDKGTKPSTEAPDLQAPEPLPNSDPFSYGSIAKELASKLKLPSLDMDFKLSTDTGSNSLDNTSKPKFS